MRAVFKQQPENGISLAQNDVRVAVCTVSAELVRIFLSGFAGLLSHFPLIC
jgi:hypothetical protein